MGGGVFIAFKQSIKNSVTFLKSTSERCKSIQVNIGYSKTAVSLWVIYNPQKSAEECFDKLWLQDCIIDIYEAEIPAKHAMMIYNLNREALVNIVTRVGKTGEIQIQDIVK